MIFRGQVSDTSGAPLNRADTVPPRARPMWFCDLGTIQWGNDLWLTEELRHLHQFICASFARALRARLEAFPLEVKAWAMRQGRARDDAPIRATLPDTDATFLNFDVITSGKGAIVLKQLLAYLGEDGFRDVPPHLLQNFSYSNATLGTSSRCLRRAGGRVPP